VGLERLWMELLIAFLYRAQQASLNNVNLPLKSLLNQKEYEDVNLL
jgi:hypothetical protein